jgi:hypothetical protein
MLQIQKDDLNKKYLNLKLFSVLKLDFTTFTVVPNDATTKLINYCPINKIFLDTGGGGAGGRKYSKLSSVAFYIRMGSCYISINLGKYSVSQYIHRSRSIVQSIFGSLVCLYGMYWRELLAQIE